MSPPWWLYVGSLSQFAPLATGLAPGRRQRGPRAWVLVWVGLYIATDVISWVLGRQGINNHWVSYVSTPLEAVAILWALSLWQRQAVARTAIRNSIPLVLLALLATIAFEDRNNFSRYTEPVLSMVVLLVALYTLATRSMETTDPLQRQDWFWICIAVAVVYGSIAALTPLAYAFVNTNRELVGHLYQIKTVVHVAAMTGLTIGLLCPTPPALS